MGINTKGYTYMENMATQNSKLPFKCRALCVSLAGASLLLILDFLLYYMGYISAEAAIWTATGVFVVAAIYESFLLSLITKHMLKGVKENPGGL